MAKKKTANLLPKLTENDEDLISHSLRIFHQFELLAHPLA